MGPPGDVKQYKLQLMQAVAENKPGPLRPFLEENNLQWDEVRNADRQNMLQIAALEGSEDCVAFMLKYPRVARCVDSRDRGNRTALHLAAAMGFTNIAQRLVEAKASLDLQDEKGCTALQLAVRFEWNDVASVLLRAGADPLIPDNQGDNTVDVARRKPDGEAAQMLAGYAGRRKSGTPWQELHKCIFPRWGPRPDPPPSPARSPQQLDIGAGVGGLSPSPEKLGARGKEEQLRSALDEACDGTRRDQDGEVIEWDGLKPRLVNNTPAGSPNGKGEDTKRSLSASPGAVSRTSQGSGPRGSPARAEVATFRMHLFFDEQVKRLEFEVEWLDTPAVGNVKPEGEADRRGLVRGDSIIEIAGRRTTGKGREELLPALKERPLLMKVERQAQVPRVEDPYLELTLPMNIGSFGEHGLEFTIRGQLAVVTAVRMQSKAFAAGIIQGDAIVRVSGQDATRLSKAALAKALEDRPQSVTIWRRPAGANTSAPWNMQE